MTVDLDVAMGCARAELDYLRKKSKRLDNALRDLSFPENGDEGGESILDPDSGEVLVYKVPLLRDGKPVGYLKVGVHEAVGTPLVEVSVRRGGAWERLREGALRAANLVRPELVKEELRFVDFSHPKVGAQFLHNGREALLMEVETWRVIDPLQNDESASERRPFLEGLAPEARRENRRRFEAYVAMFGKQEPGASPLAAVAPKPFAVELQGNSQELDYRPGQDSPSGFQPYNQRNGYWCFPACIQMILGFHGALNNVHDAQEYIACKLGLGTVGNGSGLWASEKEFEVVRVVEELSGRRLVGSMNAAPYSFRAQISEEIEKSRRPLILLNGSHASVVTGFTEVRDPGGKLLSYKVHLEDPYAGGSFALMDLNPALSRLVFTAAPVVLAARASACDELVAALLAAGAGPAPSPPAW